MSPIEARKHPQGTVGIETKAGRLRIRLPRSIADGSGRYISTRLEATKENHRKVQIIAWQIEEDILLGRIDNTLQAHLGQFRPKPKQNLVPPITTQQLDLEQLWDRFCEYKRVSLATTTYKKEYRGKYSNHIDKLPTKDLADAIAIRDWIISHLSPIVAKALLIHISACLEWAVRANLAKENPFKGMASDLKISRDDRYEAIDPFSITERDNIIAAFEKHPRHCHYASFIRFLFLTGCRTGEAIALQWKHISPDCTSIIFADSWDTRLQLRKDTKTHKSRRFPCNAALRQLLLTLKPPQVDPHKLVFTSPHGQPINACKFSHCIWKGYGSCKGVVSQLALDGAIERYRPPYNTRHTFISMALEKGLTVSQVARLVGNSPEVILQHYASNKLHQEVPVY
jgi:integrase